MMIPRLRVVNLDAPMQPTHAVRPSMLDQGSSQIVNIGSMFGSIGYPDFASYSATTSALPGVSTALRRELRGTGVTVSYVALRAARAAFNPVELRLRVAQGLKPMDDPPSLAEKIVRAIETERSQTYPGQTQSWFARLTAPLPWAVDQGLRNGVPSIAKFARGTG